MTPSVTSLRLAWLRHRMGRRPPGVPALERCGPFTVRTDDPMNYYILYKDLFVRGLYDVATDNPSPRILDGGSNIGMSILRFKQRHPRARILGFEPDPSVFALLRENVARNRLEDVTLVQAALAEREGALPFHADGGCAGTLEAAAAPAGARHVEIPCVRLRSHLEEPVDFLKLNIEGAEWPVLKDCADRLRAVDQMIVEYHHLPGLPRTLHDILGLLHAQGFEYLINDFDAATNPGVLPPFRLGPDSRHFLLIYARRKP